MATFTITTAINIDTLASKVGSDTYNINGGYLTVDQHTRYGTNQNTSAAMGNLTLSATLGGTVEFNSTKVRLIPYDTGSGVVPAYGTTISQGSASAILLCVYSALTATPTAVGAAMPASGYILVRQWNSTAYAAGALTGIGANATAADGPGWLEIVGVDALLHTANRLGIYKVRGDWWDFLGVTTDGTRATTYQIPSNGSNVYCPGVEVETDVAGVYEFYPRAGSTAAIATDIAPDAVRGRWCWISTSGAVRFGHDGTNSSGGYCPPAGRKLRVPNIFFVTCTAADPAVNTIPPATIATRMEFATTGGGVLDFENCCVNWYMNCSQPYSIALTNVFIFDNLTVAECASPIAWSNVGIGQSAALSNYGCLMSLCFAGGTMDRCTWTRAAMTASGHYAKSWSDMSGFTVTNERIHGLALSRGNAATGAETLIRVTDTTFTDCLHGAGKALLTTCARVTYTDLVYYDHPSTHTFSVTGNAYVWETGTACQDIVMDGLSHGGLFLCQAFNGILSITAAGCTGVRLRNLGTYVSPLDLGGPRQDLCAWTRVTTTATVTQVAHGLRVGDTVYVPVSFVVAAIIVGAKTVASVPTADTFTFTCLNAGATSGTLSYFPTKCANLVVFAAGAAADDVRIQRCYVPHTRTNLFTGDNSSRGIIFENVISDFLNAFLTPMLDAKYKGVAGSPSLAAQSATYGVHWMDIYNADVTPNLAAQSWSRVTTTATVTSTDHKLRTGLFINVTVSSDEAAIRLGVKTVTVLDADTFTFTCLDAGAASGTLTFRTVVDRLVLMMNEATVDSAGHYTDIVGGAAFTSAGGLSMLTAGDSITFQMTYYRLGATGFPIQELVMGGGTAISHYDITYQLDVNDGSGYGSWHNAYYGRAGSSGTAGTYTFTLTDATGVEVGDFVFGSNVAGNAVVTDITGNTVTVDRAHTGTVSGTLRFNHMRTDGPTLTSAGYKLKVKITTVGTPAAAITSLSIYLDTDDTSRALQYDLDPVTISVTTRSASDLSLVEAARVYLEADTGGDLMPGEVILNALTDANGNLTDTFAYTNPQPVIGRVRKGTSSPFFKTAVIAGEISSSGLELTTYLVPDE